MRFCRFETAGKTTYGVVRADGRLVDLKSALGVAAPDSLEDLIEQNALGGLMLESLAGAIDRGEAIDASSVAWRAPIKRPGKVLGVAINNKIGQELAFRQFANPAFFAKPASSLTGHGETVVVREDYGVTHPEPELAVIIGKPGKAIAEEDALDHVFGYSVMNDITSPGLKEKDSIHLRMPAGGAYRALLEWREVRDEADSANIFLTYHAVSKGADGFGPMGPWIVTRDEIADPNNLAIRSYDGDELVFEDSTADLTFSVQKVIAHASRYMTLEPGDIIHCGTSMRPTDGGKYPIITNWDIRKTTAPITIEIEGVGRLSNPVVCR